MDLGVLGLPRLLQAQQAALLCGFLQAPQAAFMCGFQVWTHQWSTKLPTGTTSCSDVWANPWHALLPAEANQRLQRFPQASPAALMCESKEPSNGQHVRRQQRCIMSLMNKWCWRRAQCLSAAESKCAHHPPQHHAGLQHGVDMCQQMAASRAHIGRLQLQDHRCQEEGNVHFDAWVILTCRAKLVTKTPLRPHQLARQVVSCGMLSTILQGSAERGHCQPLQH